MSSHRCIFCKIAKGDDPKTTILFQDDEIVVFKDRKPATSHHYLVVPKSHKTDAKSLGADDIQLVNTLVSVGNRVLEENGGQVSDALMGFHWPPFHSISHLHLHVISARQDMGWIARGIFRPNTLWFVTVEWLLDRLTKMKNNIE
ncbi:adenosine 5'-monophosphoramidase HINT3-like [Haliotis rufescens]|uniref:adenosine 5'-monophosphoramidase HINT3-like n=1 Tax=Haliotis rufescens TaxID=6454 RepID=UPI00201F8754|nr:adenosine 5'-monophosphoramidase HINT3-like [Haliotis rufescens]